MKTLQKYTLIVVLIITIILYNSLPAKALEDNEVDLSVDMETAFSAWTPISEYSGSTLKYPGQWSYNKTNDYVVNAENTDNMTGFYNPNTNYSDMDITIKMGSWNSDDDTLGCMIRFSEDSSHNCTGYIFAYDRGGALHGGLYKITGKQFKNTNCVCLVSFSSVKWTQNAYDTVRIKAEGDTISVWVNGVQVANYTDSDPIESGSYGFFSYSQAQSRFTQISGVAKLANFTINFDANGGEITSGNSEQIVTSTKTYEELPTVIRPGYEFDGWWTEQTGGYEIKAGDAVNISSNTTFYAHWKAIKYKNKYEHYAHGFENDSFLLQTTYGEQTCDEKFTPNETYALTTPNGFYLEQKFGTDSITGTYTLFNFGTTLTQPAYIMNFNYNYYPIDYTITYNLDGGTNNINNPQTYNILYGITFSNPTKKGYDFIGWYDTDGNKITGINENCTATFTDTLDLYNKLKSRTTGNIEIIARWELHDYEINTTQTGSGVISNSVKVTYKEDTSIFIIPAKGYSLTTLRIDNIDVTPVESYNFLNVEKDHKIEATFTITQTRKMELLQNAYSWIDLKLT